MLAIGEVIAMIRFGQLWTLILIMSAALVAQDRPPSLKIYVYNRAGVSGRTLDQAEHRASTIFRQSGIETTWHNCSVDGRNGANCSASFDSGTIVLQIVHDSEKLKTEIFGTAFMGRSGYGTYADVFFDRVQQVCQDAKVALPDILGHIISHEIGHLLLGADSHSRFGIMRATWEPKELAQADRGHLLFSTVQSKAMQQRLVAISSEAAESAGGR
jgi:hypothetical protein